LTRKILYVKWILLAATLAIVLVFSAFITPMRVAAHSMEPTFCPGDVILVETVGPRVISHFCESCGPQRGDVVIVGSGSGPDSLSPNPDEMFVKRVVAIAGDRIRIEQGMVFLNNKPLTEAYVHHKHGLRPSDSWPLEVDGFFHGRDIIIPPGSVFVLGDNRDESLDSRLWGPISTTKTVAYVLCRIRPSGKLQRSGQAYRFGVFPFK